MVFEIATYTLLTLILFCLFRQNVNPYVNLGVTLHLTTPVVEWYPKSIYYILD